MHCAVQGVLDCIELLKRLAHFPDHHLHRLWIEQVGLSLEGHKRHRIVDFLLCVFVELSHDEVLLLWFARVRITLSLTFLPLKNLQVVEIKQVHIGQRVTAFQAVRQGLEKFQICHGAPGLSRDLGQVFSFELCLPAPRHLPLLLDRDPCLLLSRLYSEENVELAHLHHLLFHEWKSQRQCLKFLC